MVGKCCIFICSSWSKLSFSSATPTCRFSFFRLAGKDLSFKVLKEGFASFGIFLMLIKFCWGLVVFKVPLCSHLFLLSSFHFLSQGVFLCSLSLSLSLSTSKAVIIIWLNNLPCLAYYSHVLPILSLFFPAPHFPYSHILALLFPPLPSLHRNAFCPVEV